MLNVLPAAGVHVLNVGLGNAPIILSGVAGGGPRVLNPTPCRIAGPCAFVLQMWDSDNVPVHVGGLISNLTLHFNGTRTPMIDERDGTFSAVVPTDRIDTTGSFLFHFEHNGVAR